MGTKTRTAPTLQSQITEALLTFIQSERAELEPEALPLLDELESLVRAGGKRVRPRFCYWGYVAGGGTDDHAILRIGASLELLHTFAIIHDDVMDDSPLRRNRSTTFRALAELDAGMPHRGDPRRFGTSAAILTGLLGFVLADRLFLTSGFGPEAIRRAAERFDRMRTRAIAGQYLDLRTAHRGEADESTARRIGELKTAGYTISEPLAIGALCASHERIVMEMLAAYGGPLGEAFQIRDDVLGAFGDPAETGKDQDGDFREGKQTVLIVKTRSLADRSQRALLERALGNRDLSARDAERVREVIVSTGALDETNSLIDELTEQAKSAIDAAVVGDEAAAALLALADEVTQRRS